jgi:DNA-binding MarR family transcriptional regulator
MARKTLESARLPKRMREKDYVALASFRRALRTFLAFSEEEARKAGLPPRQHQTLLAIRAFGSKKGITVGDLASHLLLKPHTAVGLVDRLVRAGLVRRVPDPDDRRRVFLTLTAAAEEKLKALSVTHLAEIRRSAPELNKLMRQLAAGL